MKEGRTRLLCWTDSGTRGLMSREISCFVGGIFVFFLLFSLFLVGFLVVEEVVGNRLRVQWSSATNMSEHSRAVR